MDSSKVFALNPCYSGSHTQGIDLREIKQQLLSGVKEQILIATSKVLTEMADENNKVEHMISSDISEFLCDAMLPLDSYMSSAIYKCLTIMAQFECFFTHNHSSFAMETVIRSMHFLMKNDTYDSSLSQPLNVLILIVQGYVSYNVLPEKKPFQNLIYLVEIVLKKGFISKEIQKDIGLIIKNLIELELWKISSSNSLFKLCEDWFVLLLEGRNSTVRNSTETLQKEETVLESEEIINLGCILSKKCLRFIVSGEQVGPQFSAYFKSDSVCEEPNGFIMKITNFLIQFVAPSVAKIALGNEKPYSEKLENYFTALQYYYKESLPQKVPMTRKLIDTGIIQVITVILTSGHLRPNENFQKECIDLLFNIILSLSDEVFRFPEMWPLGKKHFENEVLRGASLVPPDASQWVEAVINPEVNRSSRLALILYFYFHSLTIKSHYIVGLSYPPVNKLLDSIAGISSSSLLVKTVWFIYAMSQMTKSLDSPRTEGFDTKKMLDILNSQKKLSLVYTHHPALLYWTFLTSEISYGIQCEVVKLWLENRFLDCTALDDLLVKSTDVRLAIFGLLKDGHEHVAHSAFAILKTFMVQSQDDNLSSNIWFILPQTLAKYTMNATNAVQVDYIVELASLRTPDRPDISKTIRIASLLSEAMEKSDLISTSSALKLTFQLLQISEQHDDTRVVLAVVRSEIFMRKILSCMELGATEVVSTCLKIVTILWAKQINSFGHPRRCMTFNPYVVLNILKGVDLELIKTSLELVVKMLSTNFQSDLFLVETISTDFMETLLYVLENAIVQWFSMLPESVWICLKDCLLRDERLAEDVLLNEVIETSLTRMTTPEMMDFLIVWIDLRGKYEKFHGRHRRIRDSYFLETVRDIAAYLAENPFEDAKRLVLKILDFCRELSVDLSDPPLDKLSKLFS